MTLKILLADDNRNFIAAVWQFLGAIPDVEVVAQAHDGRDALAKARQWLPDPILLDIGMPEINRLEVAWRMLAWPQAPQVFFLSMHSSGVS